MWAPQIMHIDRCSCSCWLPRIYSDLPVVKHDVDKHGSSSDDGWEELLSNFQMDYFSCLHTRSVTHCYPRLVLGSFRTKFLKLHNSLLILLEIANNALGLQIVLLPKHFITMTQISGNMWRCCHFALHYIGDITTNMTHIGTCGGSSINIGP